MILTIGQIRILLVYGSLTTQWNNPDPSQWDSIPLLPLSSFPFRHVSFASGSLSLCGPTLPHRAQVSLCPEHQAPFLLQENSASLRDTAESLLPLCKDPVAVGLPFTLVFQQSGHTSLTTVSVALRLSPHLT